VFPAQSPYRVVRETVDHTLHYSGTMHAVSMLFKGAADHYGDWTFLSHYDRGALWAAEFAAGVPPLICSRTWADAFVREQAAYQIPYTGTPGQLAAVALIEGLRSGTPKERWEWLGRGPHP
jgi:hypothetical protein